MTEQGEVRETTVSITGVEGAEGQFGKQWKLHCRWQWTPSANQGGDQTWVNRDDFPDWNVDTRGRFPVEVRARGLKKQSQAKQQETGEEYFDGSRDWMWRWDIIRVLGQEPSAPAPQANGTKPTASLDTRIAWNSAINNAVHLSNCLNIVNSKWTGHDAEIDYGIIQNRAEKIYAMIIAGPPEAGEDVPWQDPRADRAPDIAPEGSQLAATALATAERLTRPPAVAGEAKMKELDQARYDANGDTYCTPEELVNYICNEHDERGPRFLSVEEVDKVIEDMRAGFVTDIAVF